MENSRIYVAGHGMVGSAFVRCLQQTNMVILSKDTSGTDLTNQAECESFKKKTRICFSAAK